MDSHHTGSDQLLEIRTEYIDLLIEAKGKQTTGIGNDTRSSSLKVVGPEIESIAIPVQGLDESYGEHRGEAVHEVCIFPLFFEQSDYIFTVRSRNGEHLHFSGSSSLIEEKIRPLMGKDDTILSGIMNFGNNIGFFDFSVFADGRRVLNVRIEVYPTKLSYKEDYQNMMADLNEMISESILEFMKKTFHTFVPDHKKNEVPAVFFTILDGIYGKYLQAAKRILAVPHHKLVTEHAVLPAHKAKRLDQKSVRWLEKHPEHVKRSEDAGGMDARAAFHADRVLAVRKMITYDTLENRFVKYMLRQTSRRMEDFSQRYVKYTKNPDLAIVNRTAKMQRELKHLLTGTFLAEVSEYQATQSMSLVFSMAPGYQELYRYYLMLQNGITVGGDIFHMSVRETAQMYEYWCFIKLYAILKERYELRSKDIIRVDRKGVTVDLVKGQSSRIVFENPRTKEKIFLAYNPSESKTQTVNQKPDNVLELEKHGTGTNYKYVFDAKYRIEMDPENNSFYPDDRPGPKVDDINTMHRYRDAIVYENADSRFTFEKTMFGAYILFPYGDEKEYSGAEHHDKDGKVIQGHRFYRSIDSVNIGGLPFLPSATGLVSKLLDDLVNDSPDTAWERASLPRGIEERLRTVDWDRRDVLIGLVQNREQLERFIREKRYITARFDKDKLPIRYVALYEKGVGIRWYGEVKYWSPGKTKSGQSLHIFNMVDWVELKPGIRMEEAGPNPTAYTNHFLLMNSESYSELRLRSEADYRLFHELRRRVDTEIVVDGSNSGATAGDMAGGTVFSAGGMRLQVDKNQIYSLSDQNMVEIGTVDEFRKRPGAVMKRLMRYAEMSSRGRG